MSGWYQVESPSRHIKGVAHVAAVKSQAASGSSTGLFGRRKGGEGGAPEWDVTSLRLEFNRAELEEADVRRATVSAAAGYRKMEDVQAAADEAKALDQYSDDAERSKVVMQIV